MADKKLRFLLFGEDRTASKTFQKLETNAAETSSKTGGSFKHLSGVIGGALAGAGVASFLKDSVTGWQDHQKLLRQTAAVVKSTGGAAGVTAKSMADLSDSIESNTGVDGDNVLAGENMLATFTNIHNQQGKGNDIFSQATKIMTDMSVSMGTDMKGQAIQLGKALNDPIKGVGALSKVGVTFTDQQKSQIAAMVKAGDTAGAQRVILRELSKEFGGSAKAQESSTDKMMVAFHGLQDTVGRLLAPVLTTVAGIMTHYVIPAFQSAIDFGEKHRTTVKLLGIALGVIVTALGIYKVAMVVSSVATKVQAVATGAWTAAQWLLNAALDANPIALIVIGVAALTAGIIWVATKTKFFQHLWHAAWGAIKGAFSGVFNFIKDHWRLILAIITGPIGIAVAVVKSKWQAIKNGFMGVVSFIGDKVTAIVGFITGIPHRIAGAVASIGRIGTRMGSALWSGIKGIVGDVAGFGKSLYNAVASSINILIDKIKDWHFTIGAFGVHHTFKPFGSIPDIPLMANGGIVSKPTLAIIGEAGPEAVVPLSKMHSFGAGGGRSTVVQVFVQGALSTTKEISQAVKKALEADLNGGGTLTVRSGAIRSH